MVADVTHVIEQLGSTVSLKKSRWTYNQFAFPQSDLTLPDGTPLYFQENLDLLGTLFSPDGHCRLEVRSRISKMWGRYWQLKDLFTPRSSS